MGRAPWLEPGVRIARRPGFDGDPGAVAERDLRDRVADPTACARADHQQDARLRALVHEDMACPGRAVDEIPLLHVPLLLLDDRRARAAQDEEVLLRLLGVVERRVVARLDHGEVDADLLELAALGLEKAPLSEPRALDPARLRLARVDDEPGVGHTPMLVRPGATRLARDTIAACPPRSTSPATLPQTS